MSSPLPSALRKGVRDAARDPESGLVQCAMCRKFFPDSSIQVDHIQPESEGGSHDPLNLQPLCAPKEGAGCHRIKSRNEAKARARRAKETVETNDRPGWLVGAGAVLVSTGVAARCAWLTGHGVSPGPFLHDVHSWLGYGLAAAFGGGILAALSRAGQWASPILEDFEPDEASPVDDTATRLRAILTDLLGEDITIQELPGARYKVGYSDKVNDHEDNARFKVLERVNSKMEGRWRLKWETEKDFVVMSPRPDLPRMIRHPGPGPARPWYRLPIAPDTSIDLSKTAHALIIGRTNAGKTALIRSIILATAESAARGELESTLLDPKRVELIGFRGWPGVREVVTTDEAMWQMPLDLVAEMEERYRQFEEEGILLSSHTPRVVVVDEYEDYVKSMQAMWTAIDPDTGKPRKQAGETEPPPVAAMAKLLRKARKCGIHIIIGTQRPDAKWFGGAARGNCECRIVVGSPDRQALVMAFERADVGRDIPSDLKGRFTMQNLDGDFEEDQSWYVADPANADGKNTQEDWDHLAMLRDGLATASRS